MPSLDRASSFCGLQMHDQAQIFRRLYGRMAEHLAHVEHAQAAHFEQILQHFRARAVDHVRRDLREFRRVVGDEAMAARDQFQREFAFAGAAIRR